MTVVSCIRLYFLVIFFEVSYHHIEDNGDPTFSLGFTLSTIESNLAIAAASIPTLWPLLRRWFPAAFARVGR